ncbi:MAG: ParB/RepB/Spo0J family partition protein [Burkholderiales bacterium]|nr:ParB/RepB/Spo0J family partition protein [Burkholderiales bacterium]
MTKLKGLGKGLDALLAASSLTTNTAHNSNSKFQEIALNKIKPGKYQPRVNFNLDELNELAASIKSNGVIQPIVVRMIGDSFEIIAGERRFKACELAKLDTVPAIVHKLSDQEAMAISLIENIQRKDLSSIEEAKGYKRLIDEFSLTHENLSALTGRSRSHITNILRLLKLNPKVQQMLLNGELEMGHARALLSLPDDMQLQLALVIVAQQLTTHEVEQRVARLLQQDQNQNNKEELIDNSEIERLANKMTKKLGLTTKIRPGKNGGGKVLINYKSVEQLNKLIKLF